jgi:hypothetical protein
MGRGIKGEGVRFPIGLAPFLFLFEKMVMEDASAAGRRMGYTLGGKAPLALRSDGCGRRGALRLQKAEISFDGMSGIKQPWF